MQNADTDNEVSTDVSSDEEAYGSDDIDSDDFEEDVPMQFPIDGNHELSQQMDFVKF